MKKNIFIVLLLVFIFNSGLMASPHSYQEYVSDLKKNVNTVSKFIVLIDYGKPIFLNRFLVFESKTGKLVFSAKVGHAYRSGFLRPFIFSNVVNSNRTSTGLYKVGKFYRGKFGKSIRLHGLSDTNSNAFRRAIVVHKASYGKYGALWSDGCFTFFESDYKRVLFYLARSQYIKVIR
tara:strand:- start:277 stop:807 length:531 start_codon:yes stop_codon:yes gene_type:complete